MNHQFIIISVLAKSLLAFFFNSSNRHRCLSKGSFGPCFPILNSKTLRNHLTSLFNYLKNNGLKAVLNLCKCKTDVIMRLILNMSIIILFVIIIKPMLFIELIVLESYFRDLTFFLNSIMKDKKTYCVTITQIVIIIFFLILK